MKITDKHVDIFYAAYTKSGGSYDGLKNSLQAVFDAIQAETPPAPEKQRHGPENKPAIEAPLGFRGPPALLEFTRISAWPFCIENNQ